MSEGRVSGRVGLFSAATPAFRTSLLRPRPDPLPDRPSPAPLPDPQPANFCFLSEDDHLQSSGPVNLKAIDFGCSQQIKTAGARLSRRSGTGCVP